MGNMFTSPSENPSTCESTDIYSQGTGSILQQKVAGTYRRRSSTEVMYLTSVAQQRGYTRVVHGNSGAAFISSMHGF